MSDTKTRKLIQVAIAVGIALAVALLVELVCNFKLFTIPATDKGTHALTLTAKTFDSDMIVEGKPEEDLVYRSKPEYETYNGKTAYYADVNSYVNKLDITYKGTSAVYFDIIVLYKNMFGYTESRVVKDANPIYMDESVAGIGEYAYGIYIIPVDNSTPERENVVEVYSANVLNYAVFNHFRFLFVLLAGICLGLLIVLREFLSKKFEYAFLIIAICGGFIFCLAMPLSRVVWDEESHMRGVYWLDITGSYKYNKFLQNYIDGSYENLPFEYSMSYEEYGMIFDKVNELSTPSEADPLTSHHWGTSGLGTFSYVFMAITCNICKLLGSPFGLTYILIRFTNLIMYITVVFFAIRKLPRGKMIMSAIALMPTPMFIASCVSYDTIVTGFLFLGMAYLFYMMFTDREITWWEYLVFIGGMCYGSSRKTIYIPLILLGLMIPHKVFKDKKTEKIMKIGILVFFVIMMSTFVLPALISPSTEGDLRGGTTSHAGQISNIFGHPFAYAGLLLGNIWKYLFEYGMGKPTLDFLAYLGAGSLTYLIVIYLVTLTLTSEDSEREDMNKWVKALIYFLVFGVICLIWTSMFMSYTEVGKTLMAGVHGRYYVPLLFPVLFALSFNKVKTGWDKVRYSTCASIVSGFILFYTIWEVLLTQCSF